MKYPNATNGVNKIFMSEMIALVASVIAVICSVIGFVCYENPDLVILMNIVGVVLLASFGIYIIAYILQIVGIIRAGKDEPAFRVSLFAIIALLIFTILLSIFHENNFVSFILEIAGDAAMFFIVHYIIHGIMHLAEHLGNDKMVKRGKSIFIIIYIALAFEIIVRIFEIIFGKELGEELSMPFGIAATIFKTIENILFLIYIAKGNKMLQENEAKTELSSN